MSYTMKTLMRTLRNVFQYPVNSYPFENINLTANE